MMSYLTTFNLLVAGLGVAFVAGVMLSTKVKDFIKGVPAELRAALSATEKAALAEVSAAKSAAIAKVTGAKVAVAPAAPAAPVVAAAAPAAPAAPVV